MMHLRSTRWWCTGFLLLCTLTSGCTNASSGSAVQAGGPAPEIEGADLEGRPFRLADLRGQVVLLNFWATWCPPCLEEIPDLERVATTLGPRGMQVVGVNVDAENPERLAAFAREHDITYPVVIATPRDVEAYRLTVIPTTFLIDQQGIVRQRYRGPRDYATFAQDIEHLLQEASPASKPGGA